MVDAGDGEPLSIVCGAWNFSVGDLVPLAPVGAVLPGDFAIAKRKMKGVTSNGMLCSGRELELTDDHEGIMILSRVTGAGGALRRRPRDRDRRRLRHRRRGQPARRLVAWPGWPATWPPGCACPSPCPIRRHRPRRSSDGAVGSRRRLGGGGRTTISVPGSRPGS